MKQQDTPLVSADLDDQAREEFFPGQDVQSFDKMISTWFNHLSDATDNSKIEFDDRYVIGRLQTSLGVFSFLSFSLNLFVVLYGEIALSRGFSGWVFANYFTLVIFLGGSVYFCMKHNHVRLYLAELYFWLIYGMAAFGIIGAIYLMIDYRNQVAEFCSRDSTECEDYNGPDDAGSTYLSFFLAVLLGVGAWYLVLTIFARVIFIYIMAVEHAGIEDQSGINRVIHRVAHHTLPPYVSLTRNMFRSVEDCMTGCANKYCDDAGDCGAKCTYLCICLCCTSTLFVPMTFCLAGDPESGWTTFWCIFWQVWEFVIEIFLIMLDA